MEYNSTWANFRKKKSDTILSCEGALSIKKPALIQRLLSLGRIGFTLGIQGLLMGDFYFYLKENYI